MSMKIILGSQSAGRKRVLEKMGYEFEVMPADINEKTIRFEDPVELTSALANAKADALLLNIPKDTILITSDQVVVCDGKVREKPENESEAREFLETYELLPAETVTAVVVLNTATGKRVEGIDIAKIWFRQFSEDFIFKYIASGDPFLHSGGFDHEHPIMRQCVERIEGDPDSITGLPRKLTERLINEVK